MTTNKYFPGVQKLEEFLCKVESPELIRRRFQGNIDELNWLLCSLASKTDEISPLGDPAYDLSCEETDLPEPAWDIRRRTSIKKPPVYCHRIHWQIRERFDDDDDDKFTGINIKLIYYLFEEDEESEEEYQLEFHEWELNEIPASFLLRYEKELDQNFEIALEGLLNACMERFGFQGTEQEDN